MDTPTSQPYVPTPAPAPMTPPVSPAPMHPHHRSPVVPVLIGVVVVLLLLVGANAAGVWPFSESETAIVSPSPSAVVSQSPSPSASPSVTPDPTVGWKTYQDTSGPTSYEFRYPVEWLTLTKAQEAVDRGTYSVIKFGPIAIPGCDGIDCYPTVSITTSPNSAFGPNDTETPEKLLAAPGGMVLVSDSIRSDGARVIVRKTNSNPAATTVDIFYPASSRTIHAEFYLLGNPAQIETVASTFKFTQ